VHVIVLAGAGEALCAGYDLTYYAQGTGGGVTQAMPWDPMKDYAFMMRNTARPTQIHESELRTLRGGLIELLAIALGPSSSAMARRRVPHRGSSGCARPRTTSSSGRCHDIAHQPPHPVRACKPLGLSMRYWQPTRRQASASQLGKRLIE
jgi:hypothetical protein